MASPFDAAYIPRADRFMQTEKWRYDATLIMCQLTGAPGPILDVGCNTGRMTALLTHIRGADRVTGIDVNEAALAIARERYPTCQFAAYPGDRLPAEDDTVIAVVLMNVLSHLDDPYAMLREIHRVLKSGGQAWIVTPNRHYTQAMLEENQRTGYTGDPTIKRLWGPAELSSDLETIGFIKVRHWCTGDYPVGSDLHWQRSSLVLEMRKGHTT